MPVDLDQQKFKTMQRLKRIAPSKDSLKEKLTQSLRGWTLRFIVNVLIPFTGYAHA